MHSRENDTTQRRTIYEARAQRKNIGFAHTLSKRRGLKDALKKEKIRLVGALSHMWGLKNALRKENDRICKEKNDLCEKLKDVLKWYNCTRRPSNW